MSSKAGIWPDNRKVALIITVAVELWSDGSWPVYAPMAGAWHLPGVADTHSISWAEYGATTGVYRILNSLKAHNLPATFGVSGLMTERYPRAVLAIQQEGHEIAAHSWAQDVMPAFLDKDDERANILRCADAFERLTGSRPRGWMSPRATATANTEDLLTESGFTWSGDYNDRELPYIRATASGPLVTIMHSEFTDVRGASAGPRAYRDVHLDLLEYLLDSPDPGILNLTIHAHVGGRPMLGAMFVELLSRFKSLEDEVWIATHADLADYVLQHQSQFADQMANHE